MRRVNPGPVWPCRVILAGMAAALMLSAALLSGIGVPVVLVFPPALIATGLLGGGAIGAARLDAIAGPSDRQGAGR